MADFRFRMNPRAGELPHCSAVLNGRGTRYEVNDYRTTLSLKSVVRGAARYHTPQGHYLLTPDTFLILNDGQRYSLEFDGHGRVPTETLCPFFQRGFLEQAAACAAALPELHLDDIDRATPALEFCERLYSKSGDPKTGGVARALAELHAGLRGPQASAPWLEDRLYALAQSLAGLRIQVRGEAQAFPGLRPATRMELYSRLYRGRDFLLSCYDQPLTVAAWPASRHSIFSACSSWPSDAPPCNFCSRPAWKPPGACSPTPATALPPSASRWVLKARDRSVGCSANASVFPRGISAPRPKIGARNAAKIAGLKK